MQIGADYDFAVPSCSSAIELIEIEPQLLDFVDCRAKSVYRIHLGSSPSLENRSLDKALIEVFCGI